MSTTRINSVTAISVFGLGKLGAPFAAAVASKGIKVIAVDSDPRKVEAVNNGVAPVFEPGLNALLEQCRGNLQAVSDGEGAVLRTEATFVVVPTPSDETGVFSLKYVRQACDAIGTALRKKQNYHYVVITSTVTPGATMGEIKPLLEEFSGKSCGAGFGLCYSPEFIALGSVIRDFLNPDFLLIGEADTRSGNWLEAFYKRICENDPPVARMNPVNAELTKLSVNTFVTTKISFANMLARICECVPEANVDAVTGALGLDSRIGLKYLKGTVGYGGPCFPRDNAALASFARSVGATAALAEATDAFNRQEVNQLIDLVKSHLPIGGRVGILGLSYKPNTDVTDESQGLLLAQALIEDRIAVIAYDPAAMSKARYTLNSQVTYAASAVDCIQAADVVVVTTPWEDFRQLDESQFERHSPPRVLIDCWRIYEGRKFNSGVQYVPMGVGLPTR